MNYFDLSKIDPKKHTSIRKHLLWEYDAENFDYKNGRGIVVERVVQRGDKDDWLTVFNLYGYDGVREQVKRIPYLNDVDMNFVHFIFEIPLKELKCYTRKRSADLHWTS